MREENLSQVREREQLWRSSFLSLGLLLPLVLILSLRKLQGFLLYGFPEENSLCLLSLVFIAVHVILLDKILRSYCLNDKNLTILPKMKKVTKSEGNNNERHCKFCRNIIMVNLNVSRRWKPWKYK